MSLRTKTANGTADVDAPFLSGNHKVIQYLQNSTHCSPNTSLPGLHKTSSHTHNLFDIQVTPSRTPESSEHRMRSCSDNISSPSVIEQLSRADFSLGSSLSDPAGHCSTFSSNTSSSGICSTFSDVGHEEAASTSSSEELDFNLGFDHDGVEIADLNEIEDDDDDAEDQHYERVNGKLQRISTMNSADTDTIRDTSEANLDARISELEEFLRKSYTSTGADLIDDGEFDNDDTITADRSQHPPRASFLHDSTYTLCPQDRFSSYTDHDDHDDEHMISGVGPRSNSLGINPMNTKSALLDKAPKKVVRFADVLGLDLESIRYMTPPDQSTNSLIQECIRIKLEQLRLAKSQSTPSSLSPSPFDLSTVPNRSLSSASLPNKPAQQYNLISKYFTSPSNVIPLIYERQIMLECLYTKDSIAYGTVRVHNCAYDKHVFARVTEDEWETFHDIQAWHSMNYPNDNTDTFTFEIRLGKYNDPAKVPKQIYFSVCLQAMCQEFWDNNIGWNFFLDVVERR